MMVVYDLWLDCSYNGFLISTTAIRSSLKYPLHDLLPPFSKAVRYVTHDWRVESAQATVAGRIVAGTLAAGARCS